MIGSVRRSLLALVKHQGSSAVTFCTLKVIPENEPVIDKEKEARRIAQLQEHVRTPPNKWSFERRLDTSFEVGYRRDENRPVEVLCLLERYPICLPDPQPWQVEYHEWAERWNAWKYKEPAPWLQGDQDFDDPRAPELTFKPEPLETEADRNHDIRSLRRKTQGFLYLVFKGQGEGTDARWQLPRMEVTAQDTLKSATERALRARVGDSIETFLVGNHPTGHVESESKMSFFMMAIVLDGNVKLAPGSDASDFAWLTKAEVLSNYIDDPPAHDKLEVLLETYTPPACSEQG